MAGEKGFSGWLWRIVATIILIPVILLILIAILLAIPPIQQKAVAIATGYLSDATDMDISIGRLGIRPPLDISLRDVLASDRENGDTILSVDRLLLSINPSSLKEKVVNVKALRLHGVTADTYNLIDEVRISGNVGELYVRSDSTLFRDGSICTLFNDVRLSDSRVTLIISEIDTPDTDTLESGIPDWNMDVRNVELDNVDVSVTPPDLQAHIGHLNTTAVISLADILYDVRTLNLTESSLSISGEDVYINEIKAIAVIDSTCINVPSLHVNASESTFEAELGAELSALLDLKSLSLECSADIDVFGSGIRLVGYYDIPEMGYDADIDIDHLAIGEIAPLGDYCMFDGQIKATGQGFDIFSRDMSVRTDIHIDSCIYGAVRASDTRLSAELQESVISGRTNINVMYADTSIAASTNGNIGFTLSGWNSSMPDFTVGATLRDLNLRIGSDSASIPELSFATSTDRHSGRISLKAPGIDLAAETGSHLLTVPSIFSRLAAEVRGQYDSLDFDISALKPYFPELTLNLNVTPENPLHRKLQGFGYDFSSMSTSVNMSQADGIKANADIANFRMDTLTISSTSLRIRQEETAMNCTADITFPEQHAIPAFRTMLEANIGVHESDAHLKVTSDIKNGILSVADLSGDMDFNLNGTLTGNSLNVAGSLDMRDLRYGQFAFGDRVIDLGLKSMDEAGYRYQASADISDLPLSIITSSIELPSGLETGGRIDGKIIADIDSSGISLSGEVLPKDVRMSFSPYGVELALGKVPILFKDMNVLLNDMTVYGTDSTSLIINGLFDVSRMYADITANSAAFKPTALAKNDSLPFYGNLETGINARIYGPADSLTIHSDIDILPVTDITYIIDDKNSANAKASGTLALDLTPEGDMRANGIIGIIGGEVRYSPQYYPLEPFLISKDSYIKFDGDITNPILGITATQPAKATVKTNGVSRQVDFNVGLRVSNRIDSLGLDFIIEAPKDREVQNQLATFTEEERSTIAASMLATGMYVTDYNEAARSSSYALTSIMQSRLNAIADNRMRGKAVDIDFGIAESTRNDITATDYSVKLSRSFIDDRLKVTVGGRFSDKNTSSAASIIDDLQLQWRLKPEGNTYLRLFHKSDYENVIEGELQKDGIGISHDKLWDSGKISGATTSFAGNFSHRSNYQIGPDVSATISKTNLLGWNETLSGSIHGAYYWNYKNNSMTADKDNTDSYQIGADMEISFPKILVPWNSRKGTERFVSTRIGLGYTFENIAGGYKMNEITAGISYQTQISKYLTGSFSPFTLSVIRSANSDFSDDLIQKILNNKSLFKNLIKDEFVPSMQYSISYNNFSDRSRSVATRIDATIKESGNLIGGIQALCGMDFNQKGKKFVFDNYSQFLKFNIELRNRYRLTEKTSLATRMLLGSVISYGNSFSAPLSEAFYSGGPNSIRAFPSRSLGPGNYRSTNEGDDPYFFHGGETRMEINAEYRFPLVWMLEGAVFVDAGNVWNNNAIDHGLNDAEKESLAEILRTMEINSDFSGGLSHDFFNGTALGTGFGIRFVFQSLVVRLDMGIALHAPYDTGKSGYYNIPNFWKDGVRLNFAIGYPF